LELVKKFLKKWATIPKGSQTISMNFGNINQKTVLRQILKLCPIPLRPKTKSISFDCLLTTHILPKKLAMKSTLPTEQKQNNWVSISEKKENISFSPVMAKR
jgi:hypothetical protein